MYRELRQREADLTNQVRIAALSEFVTPDKIALHFPSLMQGASTPVPQVLTEEEAVVVADVDDDFDGDTIFTMEADEAISILASLGQRVTLDDMEASDGSA